MILLNMILLNIIMFKSVDAIHSKLCFQKHKNVIHSPLHILISNSNTNIYILIMLIIGTIMVL